jgi:hypothetical protein
LPTASLFQRLRWFQRPLGMTAVRR